MSLLFKLPSEKTKDLDDGGAHLVASLKTLDLEAFEGPIWNFSIGTGIGFGFTDSEHRVRSLADFWDFFGEAPWDVKEPSSGLSVWMACGSRFGFDQIVKDHEGIVEESVFTEFAMRWKNFIEGSIFDYVHKEGSDKHWGVPVAIIFTGGHIDNYGDQLVSTLRQLQLSVPLFTGPAHAGLLGAAWNVVEHFLSETSLIPEIMSSDTGQLKDLIPQSSLGGGNSLERH